MARLRNFLPSTLAGSRILILGAAISGAFAVFGGNCPCCGKPGCPVGLGIFGLLGSLLVMNGQRLLIIIRNLGSRKKNPKEPARVSDSVPKNSERIR